MYVFVPYRGIPNLNMAKPKIIVRPKRVFVPYRGIPNLNCSLNRIYVLEISYKFSSPTGAFLISIGYHLPEARTLIGFSSPTGAFLISILRTLKYGYDPEVFVPYRGIPNLNWSPGSDDGRLEFSSPTGAFLISIINYHCLSLSYYRFRPLPGHS